MEKSLPSVAPRTSIVVRALNEEAHLSRLFAGLRRQRQVADEVILVDSGSTDDTVAIAESNGARIVRIEPEEFSFGRALNRGCEYASGEILVFVSAHTYPLDDRWLEQMTAAFAAPEVGLVYGRQTGDARSRFSERMLLRQLFPPESDPDQDSPFCNNANCAVRAEAWRSLPYDESLTGLEDLDWAKRASANGWRIAYEADAAIAHIHAETFGQIRNRYRREAIAHRRIFQDQHMNLTSALGLLALAMARDYANAFREASMSSNALSIPAFRLAQYLGTWEGFRDRGALSHDLRRRFYYPDGARSQARWRREEVSQ